MRAWRIYRLKARIIEPDSNLNPGLRDKQSIRGCSNPPEAKLGPAYNDQIKGIGLTRTLATILARFINCWCLLSAFDSIYWKFYISNRSPFHVITFIFFNKVIYTVIYRASGLPKIIIMDSIYISDLLQKFNTNIIFILFKEVICQISNLAKIIKVIMRESSV